MATRSELISDLELRLSRWKPSDDFELPRSLMSHWLDLARDQVVQADIENSLKENEKIDKKYLKRLNALRPLKEEVPTNIDCGVRFYIDLEEDVMGLKGDVGVWSVVNNAGKILSRYEYDDIDPIKDLHFSKPKVGNQMYYREGTKLFIEGISEELLNRLYYNATIVPSDFGDDNDEDSFSADDSLLAIIMEIAEEIGLRNMRVRADIDNNRVDDVGYD